MNVGSFLEKKLLTFELHFKATPVQLTFLCGNGIAKDRKNQLDFPLIASQSW